MGRGLTGPLCLGTDVVENTKVGSLGETLLLCGKNTELQPVCYCRKGGRMRKAKDLNACIASLEAVQRGGSANPEQKQSLERVVDELKRIRRKPNPDRTEQHEAIRKIVEELLRAFTERD